MITLYAAKAGEKYLHDDHDGTVSEVTLERASVFGTKEEAEALIRLYGHGRTVILELREREMQDSGR